MHEYLFSGARYAYWLDLGNRQHDGQVVLGQPPSMRLPLDTQERLRCVTERYPELLDNAAPEDDTPSCSVRMSLASQGLFTNDVVVRFAAQVLYELFSSGGLSANGIVCNLAEKKAVPIEITSRAP